MRSTPPLVIRIRFGPVHPARIAQARRTMSTAVLRQGPRFHTLRKYKSTYMKRGFTRDKACLIYKHLTLETTEDVGGILAVDSYGCAVQPARVRRPHLHPPARLPPPAPIPEILEEALTERGAPEVDARLLHRPLLRLRPQGNLLPQSAVRGLFHQLPICSRIHSGLSSITETRDSIRSSRGVKRKHDPNNIFHRSMSVRA
jgi:hypothetical protein